MLLFFFICFFVSFLVSGFYFIRTFLNLNRNARIMGTEAHMFTILWPYYLLKKNQVNEYYKAIIFLAVSIVFLALYVTNK